jgi:hypothetical protein
MTSAIGSVTVIPSIEVNVTQSAITSALGSESVTGSSLVSAHKGL